MSGPGQLANRGSFGNLLQEAKRAVSTRLSNQQKAADGDVASDDPAAADEAPGNAPETTRNEASVTITEQKELAQQLAAMQQQFELKQQEVAVLQSQVQRLCTAINETASSSHNTDSLDDETQQLRLQLQQTNSELQHCRAQLHAALDSAQQQQALLASATASKAALERRTGTLKLLLAEHIRENVALIKGLAMCQEGLEAAHVQLQQFERQRQAAEEQLVLKDEDCKTMQGALTEANVQLALLAEQQPERLQQLQQQARTPSRSSSPFASAGEDRSGSPELADQVVARQQQELLKQKQELQLQQRQLAAAAEQVQDMQRLLALKDDSLAYANRHATLLERQLESVKEQLLGVQAAKSSTAAAAADADSGSTDTARAAGFAGAINTDNAQQQEEPLQPLPQDADADSGLAASLSFAGGVPVARDSSSCSCSPAPSSNSLAAVIARTGSGLAAAIAAAAGGDAPSAAININNSSGSNTSSPKISEQLVSLSPFAKARGFMAQREENQVARLKEELREKERQVKDLATTVARAEGQLHGLQAVLSARTGQCNRLDGEVRQVERQLRQVQAAAAAEAEALHRQLELLSDRVVELEGQLGASQQREQHTQVELAAVRAKLGQVLEALLQDADALQRHDPKQHAALVQDIPAALADTAATYSSIIPGADASSATVAAAQAALASSSAAALAVMGSQGAGGSSATTTSGSLSLKVLSGGNAVMTQGVVSDGGGGGDGTPTASSGGGGLFGNSKLLGALLGRRNSAGMQEVTAAVERTVSGGSNGAGSTNGRTFGEWPQCGSGAAAGVKGLLVSGSVLSRAPSDAAGLAAILGPAQQAGSSSRPVTPPQHQLSSSDATQQLVAGVTDAAAKAVPTGDLISMDDDDDDGSTEAHAQLSGTAGCVAGAASIPAFPASSRVPDGVIGGLARPSDEVGVAGVVVKVKAVLPDPVRDKLDAVKDLLHRLGQDKAPAQ